MSARVTGNKLLVASSANVKGPKVAGIQLTYNRQIDLEILMNWIL